MTRGIDELQEKFYAGGTRDEIQANWLELIRALEGTEGVVKASCVIADPAYCSRSAEIQAETRKNVMDRLGLTEQDVASDP